MQSGPGVCGEGERATEAWRKEGADSRVGTKLHRRQTGMKSPSPTEGAHACFQAYVRSLGLWLAEVSDLGVSRAAREGCASDTTPSSYASPAGPGACLKIWVCSMEPLRREWPRQACGSESGVDPRPGLMHRCRWHPTLPLITPPPPCEGRQRVEPLCLPFVVLRRRLAWVRRPA